MKPIETPVFRPTPRCIWNSFRSSAKGRLLLLGAVEEEMNTLQEFARQDELNPDAILHDGGDERDAFRVNLNSPFGHAGCVIMASGLGRRFGGNKLMAGFSGQPMILRALAATEGIFARRVVVTRHRDVAACCREQGVDVMLHDQPLRSDTVRLGLETLGDVDSCLFCPGDQPLLSRETVAALMLLHRDEPRFIRRTACRNTPGSPVLFPGWCLGELRTLPAGRGGGYLMEKYPDRLRSLEVEDPFELMDADTPDELKRLQEHLSGREAKP